LEASLSRRRLKGKGEGRMVNAVGIEPTTY
jgi:hypothetical protein